MTDLLRALAASLKAPSLNIREALAVLAYLTPADRLAVFKHYCERCGQLADSGCGCRNY